MKNILFVAMLMLACAGGQAQAATTAKVDLFNYESALRSPIVKAVLDSSLRIVLDERDLPEYAERALPDDYTGGSKFSGFPNSPNTASHGDKCMQAFAEALANAQRDAHKQKYDLIFLHSPATDMPLGTKQFACTEGYATDNVTVLVDFVVSKEFTAQLALNSTEAVKPPVRKASDKIMTFAIADALASPEVKALLKSKVTLHWGLRNAPEYSRRHSPEDFSQEASTRKLGAEAGCKDAFRGALEDIIDTAEERGYNAVIHIRSNLDGRPASNESLFECVVSGTDADVTLTGTSVVLK